MSIQALAKITFYGPLQEKAQVLLDLQAMGILHIIPLTASGEKSSDSGPTAQAREALQYLLSCPRRRKQLKDPQAFDIEAVQARVLEIKERIQILEDDQDALKNKMEELKPWGDFKMEPAQNMGHWRFWFYILTHRQLPILDKKNLTWELVAQDNRFNYVVVMAKHEPKDMPVHRTHLGHDSLSRLAERLEEVELEMDELENERVSLTRWCALFAKNLGRLEDQAGRLEAARQTLDTPDVFALQAWAPKHKAGRLKTYSQDHGLALEMADPGPDETPPTLLHNQPAVAGGQDLVQFYTMPSYWLWDPSVVVFFSFAVFYAIIISDAGYALVMAAALALLWKKLNATAWQMRFRRLLLSLVAASLLWGVMVGSYFGVSLQDHAWLGQLKLLDINDFKVMMNLSLAIGLVHLLVANAANTWHWRRELRALSSLGWSLMLMGAGWWWFSGVLHLQVSSVQTQSMVLLSLGAMLVTGFSITRGSLAKRLFGGLGQLAQVSGAFGDIMSYLRLFALGLASASLATTFNHLAGQVNQSLPGLGLVAAFFILLFGHGINFMLAMASGVIHGLRLNFIEFFRWSIPEEGTSFRAFSRKEQ